MITSEKRLEALKQIKDINILISIAKDTSHVDILEAINNNADKKNIAIETYDEEFEELAVTEITDEKLLAEIATDRNTSLNDDKLPNAELLETKKIREAILLTKRNIKNLWKKRIISKYAVECREDLLKKLNIELNKSKNEEMLKKELNILKSIHTNLEKVISAEQNDIKLIEDNLNYFSLVQSKDEGSMKSFIKLDQDNSNIETAMRNIGAIEKETNLPDTYYRVNGVIRTELPKLFEKLKNEL